MAEISSGEDVVRVNFDFRRELARKIQGNLAGFCYQCPLTATAPQPMQAVFRKARRLKPFCFLFVCFIVFLLGWAWMFHP